VVSISTEQEKKMFDFYAGWCVGLGCGAFVGGVMFNTLGIGQNPQNAFVGLVIVCVFLILSSILKWKGGN